VTIGIQGLVSVLIGWTLLNGFMFLAQPGMVFYPVASLYQTPRDWGLEYSEVTLETEDQVRLYGWFIPREGARRVVLFLHGNAGNISHRGESIRIFHRLGLNVFIFDYRGFGRSQGSASERGLYKDARAAWDWLTGKGGFSPDEVILFGRSLGGVVAAHLASDVSPGGLIIESSFSSARDLARTLFPLLSKMVFLRFRFNAEEYVEQVACPILVLHSPDDEIIPYRLGRKLYDSAPDPKQFVDLEGGHNDGFLRSQPEYEDALGAFLAALETTARDGEAARQP
jgi:fermentation-respiration switch protein FrsA (DUF1100 family)